MKVATIILSVIGTSAAFAPNTPTRHGSVSMKSTETPTEESAPVLEPTMNEIEPEPVIVLNGWAASDALPCFGLPGAIAPTGYFDPLGFAQKGISLNDIKRYREAEVQHGRVAMLASVGYLAGEFISGPFSITGPANDQLQQVPAPAFALLTLFIGYNEIRRAKIGWVEPDLGSWSKTLFTLRDTYYPGDVGFDPLGLKPSDPKAFADMQTRELQNGRLAMLGVAGMCSQELVNHKSIMATFDFYNKVYHGINPYDGISPYDVL